MRFYAAYTPSQLVESFQNVSLLRSIHPQALEMLAQQARQVEFEAGEFIIQKGTLGDSMYLLLTGNAHVRASDQGSQQRMVLELTPGKVFGEMALLTGDARTADVVAATTCFCVEFPKHIVLELIQHYPEMARILFEILSRRLKRTSQIQQVSKYLIEKELGKGGMAVVYEAIDPILERTVALKMLSHELVCDKSFLDGFRNEARLLAQLRHPHIVQVYDLVEAFATYFIVMEYVKGQDLGVYLSNHGPLPSEQVREILCQVANALSYAHINQIVHRDIKPSNILMLEDGTVKLMDFGIAVSTRLSETTTTFAGTIHYSAPEQIAEGELDGRTDIYALGILAYKLLTGKTPFTGSLKDLVQHHMKTPTPSIHEAVSGVPDELEQFIQKATAKYPQHRFQSCEEILQFFDASGVESKLPETVAQARSTISLKPFHPTPVVESFVPVPLHSQIIQLHYTPEGKAAVEAFLQIVQQYPFHASNVSLEIYPCKGLVLSGQSIQVKGEE